MICYLDNILNYGPGKAAVEKITQWVLEALCENELFWKASKCFFDSQRVNYIGIILTLEGMEPEEEQVDAIRKWPRPMNTTNVHQWARFVGFYCRWIPDFSKGPVVVTTSTFAIFPPEH